MATILFNITDNKPISPRYIPYYTVFGMRPTLPEDVVELTIIESITPDYNSKLQYITEYWEREDNNYVQKFTIIDKPIEQIQQEAKWHLDKEIRVIISNSLKSQWLKYQWEHNWLQNHPYLALLLEYIKQISLNIINDESNSYIYLNTLYPQDEAILIYYGAIVEYKSEYFNNPANLNNS